VQNAPRGSFLVRTIERVPVRIVSTAMRRLAIVLWVVAAALIPVGVIPNGIGAIGFATVPAVFTAAFAWLVLWRPRIELTDDTLRIVDVRRTTSIPWKRVQEVRSRYGLEIVTNEGLRRTWTAPTAKTRLRTDTAEHGAAERGAAGPGTAVGTRIDVATLADRIRERVPEPEVFDGPPPTSVVPAPIVTRVHGWSVVLLIALGIAASMTGSHI
jgi:hypothetical protein